MVGYAVVNGELSLFVNGDAPLGDAPAVNCATACAVIDTRSVPATQQHILVIGSMFEGNARVRQLDVKANLSWLWLFVLLNFIYCDVMTHMDPVALKALLTGTVGSLRITPGFLLGAAFYMEIPIAMVLSARLLPFKAAVWSCVVFGLLMTAGQLASLFVGTKLAPYYIFFSVVEIIGALAIAGYAWMRRAVF
jgi:hypothetical protein